MALTTQQVAERCTAIMWPDDHAAQGLGIVIRETTPGGAVVDMKVRQDMVNGHGICHGGFIFALADTNFAQRKVTFRDLSFVSKSGQSQGLVQSEGDVFDGVNISSDDASGIGGGTEGVRVINGGTFNDVEFFGSNGGSFSRPITTG